MPHEFIIEELKSVEDCAVAIEEMHVRGAPLIGATAAFGAYFAVREAKTKNDFQQYLNQSFSRLAKTRPTAVDLFYALERMGDIIDSTADVQEKESVALKEALLISEESIEQCRMIGQNGLALIEAMSDKKNRETVNILTHCNAGWLATVDHGTALSPIYAAFDKGIKVHVWVDETRPRNQGARLTAFELSEHGIPHTIITDNAGGHLMQHGMVDMVIVGSDRTTRCGDVCNKIGTYLKALAAFDNDVPFYAALPVSSFDFKIKDGLKEISIEKRDESEVKYIYGVNENGTQTVLLTPRDSPAANFAFDVTPARLVTGIITEKGVCKAVESEIVKMFGISK